MIVNIKDKEIELKYSFRGLMVYENITNQPFQPTGKVSEFIILFYSMIMGSDNNLSLDYDEFIEYLDNNPNELDEFIAWLTEHVEQNKFMSAKKESSKEGSESKNQ